MYVMPCSLKCSSLWSRLVRCQVVRSVIVATAPLLPLRLVRISWLQYADVRAAELHIIIHPHHPFCLMTLCDIFHWHPYGLKGLGM